MFVQVIKGKVRDRDAHREVMDRWPAELKPGAVGYLGATSGVTADGTAVALIRFESAEAAARNGSRPEQGQWWADAEATFDGPVEFRDCDTVDTFLAGGSDDAGFVQVMEGRAKDQEAARAFMAGAEEQLAAARPDVIGGVIAWHGDGGGFTQAIYFRSEAEARAGESAEQPTDMDARFRALFDDDMVFYDLTDPMLD